MSSADNSLPAPPPAAGGPPVGKKDVTPALRELVVGSQDLRELEKRLGQFNIFDVLKSVHHEVRHSNVLAWLLDPNQSHGLRDLFLRRWLMQAFHASTGGGGSFLDPVEIDATPFHSVQVRREWNHIDLLIEIQTESDETWVICVENKIKAWQSAGQLQKYRERVEHAYPTATQRAYLFLTVRGEQPEDVPYAETTYQEVLQALQDCVTERRGNLGAGPLLFLEHYMEILKERFMEDSEAANLARKIYTAHKEALDFIFEQRPDPLQQVADQLQAHIARDAVALKLRPQHSTKSYIRFIPQAWKTKENTESDTWSTVLCELNLAGNSVVLKALVGTRGLWDFRVKMLELAQKKEKFPNTYRATQPPPQYYSFYAVKGGENKAYDIGSGDIEAYADDVWAWAKAEISSPRFAAMTKAVLPLLAELPVVQLPAAAP